jgi:hypothetical protein
VVRSDELNIIDEIAVERGNELKIDEDIDFSLLGIDTEDDCLLPEIDYSDRIICY